MNERKQDNEEPNNQTVTTDINNADVEEFEKFKRAQQIELFKKLIKTEKDPFMQNILDKRQLAYKVTANSLYGQCGSRTSSFYQKNIAASTTATGRLMITYAKRMY